MYINAETCKWIYLYPDICIYIHTHVYYYTYIVIYKLLILYIYIYIYTYIYIYINIYIYTYRHTHLACIYTYIHIVFKYAAKVHSIQYSCAHTSSRICIVHIHTYTHIHEYRGIQSHVVHWSRQIWPGHVREVPRSLPSWLLQERDLWQWK